MKPWARLAIVAAATAVLILAATLAFMPHGAEGPSAQGGEGLKVVVTFPCLKPDVEALLAPGDTVYSIAPPGVDPHDYQLSPQDIALLREADVIVSLGHAPFELKIRELAEKGELKAVLVEVPRLPGIEIYQNPATGQPVLHMPIYDPSNYKVFVEHLAKVFSELRPSMASHYEEAARSLVEEVDGIAAAAPRLDVVAAADMPLSIYAVSWLGVKVKYLLVPEHGAPASPKTVEGVRRALEDGSVKLVVVTEPVEHSASRMLLEMAEEYGVPVLKVPSPLIVESVPAKLKAIVEEAQSLASMTK